MAAVGAPNGLGSGPRSPYRESTLESADDAAGIFSLYGRDSWMSTSSRSLATIDGAAPGPAGGPATRGSLVHAGHVDALEAAGETEELGSPVSWSGPMANLTLGPPVAAAGASEAGDMDHEASAPAPALTLTPSRPVESTDGQRDWTASHGVGSLSASHTPHGSTDYGGSSTRTTAYDVSASAMTTSTSSATSSPAHPAVSRLSPRPGGSGNGVSGSVGGGSTSQVSIGGSSQYPGEDADAFYVRATYARLEHEGVYGDGWDEGVERTRGGAAMSAARKTIMMPASAGDLGERERAFRAKLDRYGFVDEPLRNRSESRLALVPAAPLARVPKLPARSPLAGQPSAAAPGSAMGKAATAGGSDDGPSARVPGPRDGEQARAARALKEEARVAKWLRMMAVKERDSGGNVARWTWRESERGKVRKRVYKGVPDRWRQAAWWTLAEERAAGKGKQRAAGQIIDEYSDRVERPSASDVQIDLDVPRTISGHVLFQTRFGHGQRALFHVLHSFSQLCETCGYCQGMGSIAATLLCYFDPERAYALLVRIHDLYDMHGVFAPGFPGLLETFYVQERLIEHLMPDVYQAFQRNMISSSSWGAKIYITLFVNTVPFHVQLRLWDAMFIDGYDVMIFATLAIIWAFRDLLAAKNATFESILSLLSSFYVIEDEDKLLRWIRKMLDQPGMRDRLVRWRADWAVLVRNGKAQAALL